jgi:hypothetical protein
MVYIINFAWAVSQNRTPSLVSFVAKAKVDKGVISYSQWEQRKDKLNKLTVHIHITEGSFRFIHF